MSVEDQWVLPRPYAGSAIHRNQGRVSAGQASGGQWTEKVHTESEIELFDDDMDYEKDYGEVYEADVDVDETPSMEAFQESFLSDLSADLTRNGYLAARRSHRAWRGSLVAGGRVKEIRSFEHDSLEMIRKMEREKLTKTTAPISKLTISFVTKKRNRTITVPTTGFRVYGPDHPINLSIVNAAYISAHVQLGIRQDPMEYYAVKEAIKTALTNRAGNYELKERRGRDLKKDYDLMEIKVIPS